MDTCCECLHEPVPIFAELLRYRLFHLFIHCNKTQVKIISKNWARLSWPLKNYGYRGGSVFSPEAQGAKAWLDL